MPSIYTVDSYEQTIIDLLLDKLGYEYAYGC